jgi:hypothetical protein
MKMIKLLKYKFSLLLILSTSNLNAVNFDSSSRVDFAWGLYSINGKSSRGTVSSSGYTNYRFTYRRVLSGAFEFFLGYNYLTTGIFSGDSAFGPELGINIYPYSQPETIQINEKNMKVSLRENFRPFFSTGFHQRNFQSVNSNFVGFGFGVGTDIHYKGNSFIRTEIRYLPLLGPDKSSANQLDLFVGYSISI